VGDPAICPANPATYPAVLPVRRRAISDSVELIDASPDLSEVVLQRRIHDDQ
jgi:hypothetical protein